MNPNIKIDGDLVTKKYSKEVDKEYEKAKILCNIAKANEFLSPEPITIKLSTNEIVFKYLYATGSVRDLYRGYLRYGKGKELILNVTYEAGKILACIHNNLKLETKRNWFPPQKFIDALLELGYPCKEDLSISLPQSYLHCDYGISNIKYVENNNSITVVVYDSSPNIYYTEYPDTFGPIYVDIGCFIAGLNGLIPLYEYPLINWNKINEVKNKFLSGYEENTCQELNRYYVDMFSYGCANCYFSQKYNFKIIQYLAMRALFNRRKSNVPNSA